MSTERPSSVPHHVWEWLARLHALTAGRSSAEEAEARIALVAPLLVERFPPEAFTLRSLEAVAARCMFWPTYAEIVQPMAEWWAFWRPQALRLAAPVQAESERSEPTPTERQHVATVVQELICDLAAARSTRDVTLARFSRPPALVEAQEARRMHVVLAFRQANGIRPVGEAG